MWAWMLSVAFAHGPAPAVLDVLAWDARSDCDLTSAPAILRSNIGVHRRNADGTYGFGCPSRWGDAELALAVATGERVTFAGSGGVFVSEDGGCTTRRLEVPADDTVVALRADVGSSDAWLVTRDFGTGTGSLWRLGDEAENVARWTDFLPDGLVVGDDGVVWLAAALPVPSLRTFGAGGESALAPAWPASAPLDRLTPRAVADGGVWLAAGAGADRTLWWTDGAQVVVGPGPAEALSGPVAVGDLWIAALDGRVFVQDASGWTDSGVDVDWTCLNAAPGGALACAQREARFVSAWTPAGPSEALVASLDQLGPPNEACPDPEGTCALDWLHFGAEAGLVQTSPGVCPDDPRGDLVVDDPVVAPDPDEGCGCDVAGRPWAWSLVVLLEILRRR
jgi:hypothetical protein